MCEQTHNIDPKGDPIAKALNPAEPGNHRAPKLSQGRTFNPDERIPRHADSTRKGDPIKKALNPAG